MHPLCVQDVLLISDMGSSPEQQQEEPDVVELLDMQWCCCTVPFLSLEIEQIKALYKEEAWLSCLEFRHLKCVKFKESRRIFALLRMEAW